MDGVLKLVFLSIVAAIVAPPLLMRTLSTAPEPPRPQTATLTAPPQTLPHAPPPVASASPISYNGAWREVRLDADSNGHFRALLEARGAQINAMVDTGASGVALTAADARKIGIFVTDRDFTEPYQTANGVAYSAPVRIDVLRVGGIAVYDVPASVSKPGALNVSLLGMSFLSKLKSFEVSNGKLIMRQ